jgi:hypothetical protein
MYPSTAWAGVSVGKLLEQFAGTITELNPARLVLMIVFVVIVTVAINVTMKKFANHKPAVRRDIIKLVEALRRRTPKP